MLHGQKRIYEDGIAFAVHERDSRACGASSSATPNSRAISKPCVASAMSSSRIEIAPPRAPAVSATSTGDTHRRWWKRMLPRSLYGRSLLIIILPLVLAELIGTGVFYDRVWDTVIRRLADSVASDIGFTIDAMAYADNDAQMASLLGHAKRMTDLAFGFLPGEKLPVGMQQLGHGQIADELAAALGAVVSRPFQIDAEFDPRDILISVQLDKGVLQVAAPRKRLYTPDRLYFRAVDGGIGAGAGGDRVPVHAQPGARAAPSRRRRRQFRQGPRRAEFPARRRHRGAPGGGRLPQDARAAAAPIDPAHRDAGRRVARSAHAADADAAGAGIFRATIPLSPSCSTTSR